MEKETVIKIAKFLTSVNWSTYAFYDIEERLGIKIDAQIHSLSVLKKLEAINYLIIPWNQREDKDDWDTISKKIGLPRIKSEYEIKHHIDEEGVMLMKKDTKKLEQIIKSPDKFLTHKILNEEAYYQLPVFDEVNGIIKIGNINCKIPTGTNKFYFCKAIFKHALGEFVEEDEILGLMDKSRASFSPRAVYDAMGGVNRLVREQAKIPRLFQGRQNRFRLRKELFD